MPFVDFTGIISIPLGPIISSFRDIWKVKENLISIPLGPIISIVVTYSAAC